MIVDRRGRSIADVTRRLRGSSSSARARDRGGAARPHRLGDPAVANAAQAPALRRRAGRLGRKGLRRGADHVSDVDPRRRVTRYRVTLAGVGLTVLLAAALVGLLLARSVTMPLRRLEEVAERVGLGELTARASEVEGHPRYGGSQPR